MGFVLEFQGITNFNFPKFIFLIKSSPVGYPSSAVGFSTAPLGPGWISFQSCDFLTIWRNKLAKPKPQDWDVQPLYFFFFERKFQLHVWQAKKTLKQHYNEYARDTLRMAGKETSWVGPASRTTQSSWHKHQLLGQRWGQGSRQLPAAAGRRQGKGYLWNYLKAVLLNLWSLQISPSKFN